MYRFGLPSLVLSAALFVPETSYAEVTIAGPDWYLVDEIIEDRAPDYRSDIFFADKTSVMQENGYTYVSISQIIMSQGDEPSDTKIKDLRSRIMINCNEHIYSAMEVSEYNEDNKLVTSKEIPPDTAEWILPYANSGYVSVFRFACETENEFGSQKFPGHIQPLVSIMAYLNADWRN